MAKAKEKKIAVTFQVPEYMDGDDYLARLMAPIEVAHDASKAGLELTDEDQRRLGASFAELMVTMGLI